MYALRGEAVGIEGEAAVPSLDSGNMKSLHLLGLSVQFGVRASKDYDHPFLLFYTFGGFLAKYLYRYSRRHAIRIYPRYKRILVR